MLLSCCRVKFVEVGEGGLLGMVFRGRYWKMDLERRVVCELVKKEFRLGESMSKRLGGVMVNLWIYYRVLSLRKRKF